MNQSLFQLPEDHLSLYLLDKLQKFCQSLCLQDVLDIPSLVQLLYNDHSIYDVVPSLQLCKTVNNETRVVYLYPSEDWRGGILKTWTSLIIQSVSWSIGHEGFVEFYLVFFRHCLIWCDQSASWNRWTSGWFKNFGQPVCVGVMRLDTCVLKTLFLFWSEYYDEKEKIERWE